jgi:hypothetical protein
MGYREEEEAVLNTHTRTHTHVHTQLAHRAVN